MKILHVLITMRGGGAFTFLQSLMPAQIKLGDDVKLCVIDRFNSDFEYLKEKELNKEGIEIIHLNREEGNKFSFLLSTFKLFRFINKYKPDIINSHLPMSHVMVELALCFYKYPHCATIHSAPEKWGTLCQRLNRKTPLIFCSHSAYKLRAQNNPLMEPIDNGISTEIVKTEKIVNIKKELGLDESSKVVILVGSLRDPKNYPFLIDIVEELKNDNIHFCIAGGSYGPGYYRLDMFDKYPTIHTLGLRSDVSAIENGCDAFMSLSLREGLPIAVLEAMFNGMPCVLSPIEQHKAIAEDICFCFFPDGFDAKSYVASLKSCLAVNLSHNEIYNKRQVSLTKYKIEYTADSYRSFYQKCINYK